MDFFECISLIFVLSGIAIAAYIAVDTRRNPQMMKIMNIVWILTGLWASWLGLWAYLSFGREKAMRNMSGDMAGMKMQMPRHSHWQSVALCALHCGAGCTLADIVGECIAQWCGMSLPASWLLDFFIALFIGIAFQYAAIMEMGGMSKTQALAHAAKADVLSLTSWQAGMYAWMALVMFVFFKDMPLQRTSFEYAFMMQVAMLVGFFFAYPVNALLIRLGIKKAMS